MKQAASRAENRALQQRIHSENMTTSEENIRLNEGFADIKLILRFVMNTQYKM
jgi:hypothetical protein